MTLSALIFDVDGTLANTERDGHRLAFNQAFQDAGLEWCWSVEYYGQLLSVAGGKERIRAFLVEKYASEAARFSDSFIADLHANKTRHYHHWIHEGTVHLRPGVRRLLYAAKNHGLRLGIATTTTLTNVHSLLSRCLAESDSLFDFIGAGDQVSAKKPAPEVYHLVLSKLAIAGQQCLAIEDSALGLQAALAADIPTIITTNEYTLGQDFSGALLVLDQLGEIADPGKRLAGKISWQGGVVDVALLQKWHQDGTGNQ